MKSECTCTHVLLRAYGFSESDINGHAKSCVLNFVSIITPPKDDVSRLTAEMEKS